MRSTAFIMVVLLSLSSVALGQQLYEWVDEKGQRNFTDDPNKVPEKYRAKTHVSPGIQASPETIRRDAERRRQEESESAENARRRAIEGAALSQQAQFTQAALACASASRLDINIRPQGGIDILGNERQRFEFQKCMNTSGQPLVRYEVALFRRTVAAFPESPPASADDPSAGSSRARPPSERPPSRAVS